MTRRTGAAHRSGAMTAIAPRTGTGACLYLKGGELGRGRAVPYSQG